MNLWTLHWCNFTLLKACVPGPYDWKLLFCLMFVIREICCFFPPSHCRTLHRKLLSASLFPALLCVWLHLSIWVFLLRFNLFGLDLFSSLCYVITLQCHVSLSGTFTLWIFLSFPFLCVCVFSDPAKDSVLTVHGWIWRTHLFSVSRYFLNTKEDVISAFLRLPDAALRFNLCMITVM